jgi:hypothetical protein
MKKSVTLYIETDVTPVHEAGAMFVSRYMIQPEHLWSRSPIRHPLHKIRYPYHSSTTMSVLFHLSVSHVGNRFCKRNSAPLVAQGASSEKMKEKAIRRSRNAGHRSFLVLTAFSVFFMFALSLSLGVRTVFAIEPLDRQITLDISANTPLEDALIEWGLKAGLTVMINAKTVSQYVTPRVSGRLTARQALILLLEGSRLSYTLDGERVQIIPTTSTMHGSSAPDPLLNLR